MSTSSEEVAWGVPVDEVEDDRIDDDERVALVEVERVVNVEVEEEVVVGTVGRNVTVANLVRVVVT